MVYEASPSEAVNTEPMLFFPFVLFLFLDFVDFQDLMELTLSSYVFVIQQKGNKKKGKKSGSIFTASDGDVSFHCSMTDSIAKHIYFCSYLIDWNQFNLNRLL